MSEIDPVEYLKKNFFHLDQWKDVLAGKYFLQNIIGERAFVFNGDWYYGTKISNEYSPLKNKNMIFSMFLNPTTALYNVNHEKLLEEMILRNSEGLTLYDDVDDCYYPVVLGRIHSYIITKHGRETKELSMADHANLLYNWCVYDERFGFVYPKQ